MKTERSLQMHLQKSKSIILFSSCFSSSFCFTFSGIICDLLRMSNWGHKMLKRLKQKVSAVNTVSRYIGGCRTPTHSRFEAFFYRVLKSSDYTSTCPILVDSFLFYYWLWLSKKKRKHTRAHTFTRLPQQ